MHRKSVRAESERTQAGLGFRQLDRIDIKTDEPSAGLDRREHHSRMAAVAERTIDCDFPRPWGKDFHHLTNHDRTMRARWGPASVEYLRDVLRIALRRMLFIFLREMPRVFSVVPLPPSGFFGIHIRLTTSVQLWTDEGGTYFLRSLSACCTTVRKLDSPVLPLLRSFDPGQKGVGGCAL